jgi:nucleotide-binding universal stress UspA family protein
MEAFMPFRKILIALDAGPISAHVADVGIELGRSLKSDMALIHVVAYPVMFGTDIGMPPTQYTNSPEIVDLEKAAGREPLGGIRKRLSLEPSIPDYVECGDTADEIVKASISWSADLIVIGSHGRAGLDRVILGSVAESVMRSAHCPVLVVRSPK